MPGRTEPLVTDYVYHVFNLGIDHRATFTDLREYRHAKGALGYYRFTAPPVRFAYFLDFNAEKQIQIIKDLHAKGEKLVKCLAFCFMPNHFHFLLQQVVNNGISKFMSNFQNSYTRYFNVKHSRKGPLFLDQFKAVRIETDEQLVHVCRYIHLNPSTAYLIKDIMELESYQWSSFSEYLYPNSKDSAIAEPELVLSKFNGVVAYKNFVFDQGDYQRQLNRIKHLTIES